MPTGPSPNIHISQFSSQYDNRVKNIGFTGIFRLIFRPLVNEFPCFGAKKLDFTLKVIGGDMTAIPGLSDAIEVCANFTTCNLFLSFVILPQLPRKFDVDVIVFDKVEIDLELKPTGVLEVKLVQAKELTNKDIIGKSDPFAKLYVRPIQDRMKESKIITVLNLMEQSESRTAFEMTVSNSPDILKSKELSKFFY
ncbi:Synaptotagmin-4 [Capsicum baccatum]|uniref:Synaptotagmin-4 n=1 Tax=Capsicum baccatum TaxID=33114 RepID=A0A2G2WJD5_CAPBA|nr:Synaptotagmin-4 [Capsicum baccatum]